MSADSQQVTFTRQASILRKNLGEWDIMLHNPRGEDWAKMLGRLNAAMNQTGSLDNSIDDVMEHFVYLPKQATANPQDIPFFLSTKLDSSATDDASSRKKKDAAAAPNNNLIVQGDPAEALSKYEEQSAKLVQEYEEEMVRF